MVSRPFLRRRVQLTCKVRWARVMPTYIRRRSSCRRVTMSAWASASAASSAASAGLALPASSILKGSMPSVTPTSITCGHSRPLAACKVDRVTTFWSFSRSLRVESKAMVCATSSKFLLGRWVIKMSSSVWPPQRWAIHSQNSITLVHLAAAIGGLSSVSKRCFS